MMVLGIAGAVASAVGTVSSAMGQAAAANYQAEAAENNARTARMQASADAADQDRSRRRRMGMIRAAYGESGVQMAGSALEVYGDQVLESELDIQKTRYRGEVRATGYENEANLRRAEAGNLRTAGMIGGATGLLSGVGNTLMRAF